MQDKLIEGKEYHLWRGDVYLGIGTYSERDMRILKDKFFKIPNDYRVTMLHHIDHYQQASELLTTK